MPKNFSFPACSTNMDQSHSYKFISKAQCKNAVSPLLMHSRYCSLALNHRYCVVRVSVSSSVIRSSWPENYLVCSRHHLETLLSTLDFVWDAACWVLMLLLTSRCWSRCRFRDVNWVEVAVQLICYQILGCCSGWTAAWWLGVVDLEGSVQERCTAVTSCL